MMDNKNLLIAIVMSAVILFGWQYFYEGPRLEKQQALLEQQRLEEEARQKKAEEEEARKKAEEEREIYEYRPLKAFLGGSRGGGRLDAEYSPCFPFPFPFPLPL